MECSNAKDHQRTHVIACCRLTQCSRPSAAWLEVFENWSCSFAAHHDAERRAHYSRDDRRVLGDLLNDEFIEPDAGIVGGDAEGVGNGRSLELPWQMMQMPSMPSSGAPPSLW